MLKEQNRFGTQVEREPRFTLIRCFPSRITIQICGSSTTSKISSPSKARPHLTLSSSIALMIGASTSLIWARLLVPIHLVIITSVTSLTSSWLDENAVNACQAPRSRTASRTLTASRAPTWKATMITCQMLRSSCLMWLVPGARLSRLIALS